MAEVSETTLPAAPPMRFALLRLLRPRQWVKNGFVFAPLVFTGLFSEPHALGLACAMAVLFAAASAVTYVFNDLYDLESDRRHPKKRLRRPLAAGAVTPGAAWAVLGILEAAVAAGAAGLAFHLGDAHAVAVLAVYQILNVLYTLKLKDVPIVDIFCVAAGFVLRVYAGAVVLSVPLSPWMLNTTLCLALFLVATKRLQEKKAHEDEARAVLREYPLSLLEYFTLLSAVGALIFYGIFVLTVRKELALSIPLVLFGFFRYRYIVECLDMGESPTDALWKDLPLALTVLAWAALCAGSMLSLHPAGS
ncbi:MAG: decaprenyl-phosphate phosphoribosyltransferase [Planctomycetota bacterium]|nr:decaprenyl-phosphate phosphoribosyltransferase [Planctomycetota bacterium]